LPRIGRLGVGKSNSKGHDTRAIDHPANAMGFPDGDCRRFDSSSVHWPREGNQLLIARNRRRDFL
ncbi:MAG: hypothetical protein ACK6D3_12015, partial [Planctomycetaceae bacterium]